MASPIVTHKFLLTFIPVVFGITIGGGMYWLFHSIVVSVFPIAIIVVIAQLVYLIRLKAFKRRGDLIRYCAMTAFVLVSLLLIIVVLLANGRDLP